MSAMCIKCWNPVALVKMHLDGTRDFECGDCGEAFTCEDVRATLEAMQRWEKLLKYAEGYPNDE